MNTSGKDGREDDEDRTMISPTQGGTGRPGATQGGQSRGPVRDGDDDDATRISSSPPQDHHAADDRTRHVSQLSAAAPDGSDKTTIMTDPGAGETRAPAGKLTIGTLINNNYRIDAVLKSGGMGEVYRGTEIHTENPVAIKAILQERADDVEAGLMFRREASTLSRLSDDTIVRYLNFVPDSELQRYFLVMEFIEGVPLKDYVKVNGPLPVAKARTLLSRLAKGLAVAHEREVIHRDLSPDNVMLAGGEVEQARLIDFGIAKSAMVSEATIAGRFAGKFKYVAPEQLGHFGGVITPATDIYGLALLTAAAVIGKSLDMGSSIVEAVQSRQSIPDLTSVPDELRPILSHMLEPNPENRPGSMREVKAMVDDPSRIPQKYLGDWVPTPGAAVPETSMAPGPSHNLTISGGTTTGLQVPTLTQPGARQTQFGTGLGTQGPQTMPPQQQKGSSLTVFLAVALLAGLGGAGYYAWSNGYLAGPGGPTDSADQNAEAQAEAEGGGIPAPLTNTREGFLAAFDVPACTHVSRVAQGPNAGVIEVFSANGTTLPGLPDAYERAFGARPEILQRPVAPQQCAVLDFARALQGRGRGPNGVQMFLSANDVPSRVPVTAQLTVPSTQSVWLLLISPRGLVYNLSGRLSAPVGNSRTMGFGLTLGQGVNEATQLLLAVETDEPLARAALVRDQDTAAAALPRVLDEIAERGGAASATLSYLRLIPAADEPDPDD